MYAHEKWGCSRKEVLCEYKKVYTNNKIQTNESSRKNIEAPCRDQHDILPHCFSHQESPNNQILTTKNVFLI